jgi:hypothetical protein
MMIFTGTPIENACVDGETLHMHGEAIIVSDGTGCVPDFQLARGVRHYNAGAQGLSYP